MANYTQRSNVQRALATLIPALKTYIDNKEPDLSAVASDISAMKAVISHECSWAGAFFDVVPYLANGTSIPLSMRGALTVLPYFEGARLAKSNVAFEGCALLEEIGPGYDYSYFSGYVLFYKCAALRNVPQGVFDTCRPTYLRGTFNGCTALTRIAAPPQWYEKTTDMQTTFSDCVGLTEMGAIDSVKCLRFWSTFSGCTNLRRVESLDASSAIHMYAPFNGCPALTYALIKNLGAAQGFTHTMEGHSDKLQPALMTGCNAWGTGSDEALESLRQTFSTELFDRVAAGFDTAYIVMRKEVGARLTAENIAMATAKGFTLIFAPSDWVLIDKSTLEPVDFNGNAVANCEIHRAVNDPGNELNNAQG